MLFLGEKMGHASRGLYEEYPLFIVTWAIVDDNYNQECELH